ncbi:hypothetical protein HDV00_010006 [Rhizophlyctis rosea]|nr:hypothetical protein HDV00_010006 [Rhizophlyctis rosea]
MKQGKGSDDIPAGQSQTLRPDESSAQLKRYPMGQGVRTGDMPPPAAESTWSEADRNTDRDQRASAVKGNAAGGSKGRS